MKNREKIEDDIINLMVEYGPDGHADGSDKITDYVIKQIEKAKYEEKMTWVKHINKLLSKFIK